ncbi:7841_t:CDS:1, partial [Gigaspora rosea]
STEEVQGLTREDKAQMKGINKKRKYITKFKKTKTIPSLLRNTYRTRPRKNQNDTTLHSKAPRTAKTTHTSENAKTTQ